MPSASSRPPLLLAVPNASAGRDERVVEEVGRAMAPRSEASPRLLDVHRDPDHDRSVFTLAGRQGELAEALVRGARGAACAEALTAAALLGDELALPVFLYGDLATAPERSERAFLRAGGPEELSKRIELGELVPDHGPPGLHP